MTVRVAPNRCAVGVAEGHLLRNGVEIGGRLLLSLYKVPIRSAAVASSAVKIVVCICPQAKLALTLQRNSSKENPKHLMLSVSFFNN